MKKFLTDIYQMLSGKNNYNHENFHEDIKKDLTDPFQKVLYDLMKGNKEGAFETCKIAAEEGIVEMQYTLGLMYYNGEGVNQNYTEALIWWLKAADLGYVKAYLDIGALYATGEGIKQDKTIAAEWWQKALEIGETKAQILLDNIESY